VVGLLLGTELSLDGSLRHKRKSLAGRQGPIR